MDAIERGIKEAITYIEKACRELDAAEANGKRIVQVRCSESAKRGDTIDIYEPFDTEENPEVIQARVVAVNCETQFNQNMEFRQVYDAICIVLEPGDTTTEKEFSELYAEEGAFEQHGPDVCSCGADRLMCERNQRVFGGHLK